MPATKKPKKRPLTDAVQTPVQPSPRVFEADLRRATGRLANSLDDQLAPVWHAWKTANKRSLRSMLAESLKRAETPDVRDVTAINAREVSRAAAQTANAALGQPLYGFGGLPRSTVRNAQARAQGLQPLHKRKVGKIVRQSVSFERELSLAQRLVQREHARADRRSKIMARQLTSEIAAKEVQRRNQELGIDRYMWVSSHDERVRKLHRELNGSVQLWSKPPLANKHPDIHAHPGRVFGCRCTASPLKDDVLDLLNGPGDLG